MTDSVIDLLIIREDNDVDNYHGRSDMVSGTVSDIKELHWFKNSWVPGVTRKNLPWLTTVLIQFS